MKWLTASTMALALVFASGALAQDDFDDLDALLGEDAPPAEEAIDAFADAPAGAADAASDGLDDLFGEFDDASADAGAAVEEVVDDVAETTADAADDLGDAFGDLDADVAEAPVDDTFDAFDDLTADDAAPADIPEEIADDPFGGVEDDLFGASDAVADAAPELPAEPADAADAFDGFDDDFSADVAEAADAFDENVPEVEEVEEEEAAPALPEDKRTDRKAAKKLAKELEEMERVRRAAEQSEADRLAQEGGKAIDAGKLPLAAERLAEALERMPAREQNEEIRAQIARDLAGIKAKQAVEAMKDPATYEVARKYIDDGLVYAPDSVVLQRLDAKLTKLQEKEAQPKPPKKQAGTIAKADDLKDLYREARQWYALHDYDRAEALFEKMLEIDPYNRAALRYLEKLGHSEYKLATMEYHARRENMVADIRRTWSPPNRQTIEIPEEGEGQGAVSTKPRASVINEKMKNIVIPKLEFRQANIADVVNYLVDASIAADPAGEGVNIILNVGGSAAVPTASAAPAASNSWGDDDWGMGEADDYGSSAPMADAGGSGIPPITLNLRNITMADAVQFITEVAQLKYRIEDAAVIITRKDAPVGNIITRMYPVQPSFMNVIQEPLEQDNGGDFVSMGQDVSLKKGDVREFFESAGVPFPTGASITYNPTISQLIVANTAENLESFERILQNINQIPNQVEIEARFIEVNQNDLEELGFQWSLNDNWEIATKNDGSGGTIQMNAGSVTRGNRFFVQDNSKDIITSTSSSVIDTVNQAPIGNIATFASVLTNPEVGLTINALSQHGASDLLSAPKVTTRSGAPAIIQVVREIRYPNDYDLTQPTTDSDGNVTMGPVVQPTDFQMRPTGVILNVTPTVGPDGYTIDLMLEPEVCDLVEWIDYGSSFTVQTQSASAMGTMTEAQTQSYNFKMDQPVFRSSKVNTSLVIWDGQTVVMGGLIREEVITFHDKIPILGDIPLLGWFFRSNGEYSQKKNLLIFVTARLVDPAGRPIHGDNAVLPGAGVDTSPVE
ncbi:MAG: hypothetical protein ILO10_05905 [Kiritimatiellae bacterium]|nr:hypothetical protein [Kiritimatiellia bacterium]